MPCFTRITVFVNEEHLDLAKKTLKKMGYHESALSKTYNGYEAELSTYANKAEFKTEYGIAVARKHIMKQHGAGASVRRYINDKRETVLAVRLPQGGR